MTTPIAETNRYIGPEVTVVYFLDTVADLDGGPTRSELDLGQDLTHEIAAMTGWEITSDRVAVPDLGSRFTARISGRTNPGDSQIVFYADQATDDIRSVLARGDQGYVYIADGGDVAGQKARLFAVDVSAVTPTTDVGGTEAARVMVDFAITGVNESVTIPT
jgi:hypothetical protein